MSKTNFLICSGEACPLKLTCLRFSAWLDNEEEEADEIIPDYVDCKSYEQKQYYGD